MCANESSGQPVNDDQPTVDSAVVPSTRRDGTQAARPAERSASTSSEKVGDRIGPYLLTKKLGEGGMGTVYQAEQHDPVTRQVALKVIKAGMDTRQVIARFDAERQALSMMDHTCIARALEAGTTSTGRPYFVMELVQGLPVTRFCDQQCLSIEARLEMFIKVCAAIQHAHLKGIIHRDVKPSNILVARQDGVPLPKVIDFGVAKAISQQPGEETAFTMLGQIVGTLEYMSPEQAQLSDAGVDTRSDIYSLGVVLYELMTGTTPLGPAGKRKSDYLEMLSRIKQEEPRRPSTAVADAGRPLESIASVRGVDGKRLVHQLRGELDLIVLKALDKDPARRYQTVQEMSEDVQRFLNAEPISARPPTGWYLVQKFAKRNRPAVIAGIAVLATLIAGIGLTAWQAVRATTAEGQLEAQLEQVTRSHVLEKQNQELTQKIRQKAEIQKATQAAEIDSLIRRGQWQPGLEQMDLYTRSFGALPIRLGILRLHAYDGLSRREDLKQEIIALESHPDAALVESELLLWRGYAFLDGNDQTTDSRTLIQLAIDGSLDEDDRLFARGLIAATLPVAVEQYRRALRLSPFHSRARLQLVVSLIFLGRYEEVLPEIQIGKALFGHDERFYVAGTVAHALAGNSSLARRSLREINRLFPNVATDKQRSLVLLSQSINRQFREYDRQGLFDWISVLPDALGLFEGSSYESAPLPEFQKVQVSTAYGQFVNSLVNPLLTFATQEKKHRFMIDRCRQAWDTHPDNVFKCFEGWSWLALNNWQQAAEAFRLATTSDGLFPDIRNQACYGLFLSQMQLYGLTSQTADAESGIEALRKYLSGPEFELHRAPIMLSACCQTGHWNLARDVCDRAIRQGEAQGPLKTQLINFALAGGKTGLALEICEELVDQSPQDPALQRLRETILLQLSTGTR